MAKRRRTILIWLLAFFILSPMLGLFAIRLLSPEPRHLGPVDGKLSACPSSPNCVSTQARDELHRIDPLPLEGSTDEALQRLKSAIATIPRLRVVSENQAYLRVEATSLLFRFVDDVEFLVDEQTGTVQARSASRIGYSDLGANRNRLQRIQDAVAAQR